MKGISKYKSLLKRWNDYTMNKMYSRFIRRFPDTLGEPMKVSTAQKFLVSQDWIEEVQRFAWKSAKASGRKISFEDFQQELFKFEVEGEKVNVWANSYVRPMGSKFAKGLKTRNKKLRKKLDRFSALNIKNVKDREKTLMNFLDDIPTPKSLSGKLELKKARREISELLDTFDDIPDSKKRKLLKRAQILIRQDITVRQQRDNVLDTFDKVLGYQGRRIAQDQLQRSNNEKIDERAQKLEDTLKPDEILVTFWKLSPTHKPHYFKGGDPCEKYARNNDGYGRGSNIGVLKPVEDTHMNCKCEARVEKRKKKK